MVKADLTRDYYGDLELQPGADIADIKKQFKKLALTYHPDRNPGRESEVTAKFQKIQSAHEVLTDAQERAKYDNNRNRASTRFGNSYAGSSGVRGNPWSDAGSNFPPPPKHPTTRQTPQRPSAGAERYSKWQAPKQAPHQAAHEGAGARKQTYEAWESMRTKVPPKAQPQTTQPGPGRTWKAPQPPPRGTPQSGQQESNARTHAPPPKTRPGFDDFRQEATPGASPHRRSQSTNATNRKGFMPNTPGGDEPAAPMGAYFTQRNKPAVAPDLPAREPQPQREQQSRQPRPREPPPATHSVGADPLRQFRESETLPPMEPRISTPYATHGGEKLNPFESSNLHRSRSTREPSHRYAGGHVPRTGSDPNLSSPHRSKSFVDRGASKSKHHAVPSVEIETDSSDDGPQLNGRPFGKPRVRKATNGASPAQPSQQAFDAATQPNSQRKPSKISQFRQWYKENPDKEPPLNGFPADGPPLRSGQAQPTNNGEPSMYAYSAPLQHDIKRASTYPIRLPTVSETITSSNRSSTLGSDPYDMASMKYPNLFPNGTPSVAPPSGITEEPISLTAFEGLQRTLVDQLLLNKRRASSSSIPGSTGKADAHYTNQNLTHHGSRASPGDAFYNYRDSAEAGSPSKKSKSRVLRSEHSFDPSQARAFWSGMEKIKSATNDNQRDRFSFSVNDDTFKTSSPGRPRANEFSSSAENISTKFSTQDWDGKFAAGSDYFKPEPKPSGVPSRSRAQSGSRSRGRSPVKPRPIDPHYMPQRGSGSEPTIESPGGTNFSPKEWTDTFKPQTFAPPPVNPPRQAPIRKRTGPTIRPTMGGNAAVVDDGETSDEKPLFTGRKPPATPTMPSPDAMDVDMPPVTNTVPQFKTNGEILKINISPKRAAAPSQSPTDEAALKVNFDDLKIQDLLSSLDIPLPPTAPALPPVSPVSRPSQAAYEDYQLRFAKYMTAWDLYNKQFMLHLVARKNQNDNLGPKRWLDEQGLETYRRGLKEDGVVLSRWAGEKERHEHVIREWVVLREKMKEASGGESRPRKKTH